MKFFGLILLCISAVSASFRQGYIIGGEDADITDWPFMVSLQSFGHFCGAVIFSSTHIVTAAHCVYGSSPSSITLMVGTNSQDNPNGGGQVAYYDVEDIVTHEDYNFPDNDIAVLFVAGEIELDGVYVDSIALAESDAEDFVGADCQIAGWGQDENGGAPDILQYAPVNVISTSDCQDDWGNTISDNQICIRDPTGQQGACFGDSGGPMTCIDESGNRVLTGTTSGGSGNCNTRIAAYYARISFHYEWIQDQL